MSVDARSIVTTRIAAQYSRFPQIEPSPLLVDGLDARDAAFARAIDHAVHRRWISLTTVLDNCMDRKVRQLDGPIGATLLVAAAQALLLNRIPDHAIIHNAVEWIKQQGGNDRVAGFVNAVLRKLIRTRSHLIDKGELGNPCHFLRGDGSAYELHEPIFQNEPALQCGFEPKAWQRLSSQLNAGDVKSVALNSLAEAPCIITVPQGYPLPNNTIEHALSNCAVLEEGVRISSLLEENPQARIQDPTSVSSMAFASMLRPQRILDVCAGKGTKTKQLRSMFPDAMIGATEPNERRRSFLKSIEEELDITIYSQDTEGPNEPFDLVVVDVPCSNSGVFARRPEAKYRYKDKKIESLVALQREILQQATQVLKKKGHLLYTTCSVDRDENQSQIHWLTEKSKFSCIEMMQTLPKGMPGSDPTEWHDGGFAGFLQLT